MATSHVGSHNCEALMNMRFHRASHRTHEITQPASTSVHVLRDEDDLREAIQRAAEFDQRTADLLLNRSARYRSLLAHSGEPRATAD
jgi:hypothetical protein